MGIRSSMGTIVQHVFLKPFFNLMGATVSNVLEKIVPMLLVILSSSSVLMGT